MVGLHGSARMVWAVQELQRLARVSPASLEPIRRDQVRDCGEAHLLNHHHASLHTIGRFEPNLNLAMRHCSFKKQGPTRSFILAPLVQKPIPHEHHHHHHHARYSTHQ